MVKIDILAYFFCFAEDFVPFQSVLNEWKAWQPLQSLKDPKFNIYCMPKYGKIEFLAFLHPTMLLLSLGRQWYEYECMALDMLAQAEA